VSMPAYLKAPLLSADKHCFPLIAVSPGLTATFFIISGICCDLASHGYVVASVEHKDGSSATALRRVPGPGVQEGDYDNYKDEFIPFDNTYPMLSPSLLSSGFELRNRQVKIRAAEVGQVYDLFQTLNEGGTVKNMLGGGDSFDFGQFKDRLDLEKVAVMGHSYGGSTVVQTMVQDKHFKCGLALDSWLFPIEEEDLEKSLDRPLVFINTDTFQWPENVAKMMKFVERNEATMYTLKGCTHLLQCDLIFINIPGFQHLNPDPILDKYVGHQVHMDLCHAFLKRHLLTTPEYQGAVPILDGGEGSSEHVIHGTNIDWKSTGQSNKN
uniref:1-alkyl-2-acetylglycerophosphocholine esterase n=1 Tax=Amphimedon queenslandica TaxID=400682 RepID=A0A1X7VW70_AMPQE